MEIGWAVDKGLDVLKVSYQVYRAFNDPDSNAPKQFRDLSIEFSTFHIVFSKLLKVLEEHNRPLLVSITSIEYTLNKCRLFQQKFGVLSEVSTKRTIKQGLTFGLRTLQWSFLAEKVANDLRAELASHSRILSLYTDTLSLQNAFEERVENYEIREQNREILRILQTQQHTTESIEQDQKDLTLPEIPQHQPSSAAHSVHIDLPDVPQHEPRTLGRTPNVQLADLDAVCRDLETLERFLDTEGRVIADVQLPKHNSSSRNGANFIDLARHELDLQLERVNNYQKRIQSISSRSATLNSNSTRADSQRRASSIAIIDPENTVANLSSNGTGRISSPTSTTHRIISAPTEGPATRLQISVPIEQASLGSSVLSRRESMIRRSASLPDDASITLRHYLARFEAELEELDEYDVDGQISKTREGLFDLLQRSFPPSPDLTLSPRSTPSSIRISPSISGLLSSSPPSATGTLSPSRRSTLTTTISRRSSIGEGQWQYLAKDVHIDGVPYTCAKCTTMQDTALQLARRSSGGLCFSLICMASEHSLADGLLFRHDLSSTIPAYPHVYHRGANPHSESYVRVLGQPSRLEAYVSGQRVPLKIPPFTGVCYKFASTEDSEVFQQVVFQARLLKQFDVKAVTSSAYTGHPPRHIAVRLWESVPFGSISIMLNALLVDKCEALAYTQQASSFATPTTSGSKVKLKVAEPTRPTSPRHGRTNSRDSSVSALSVGSDDATINGSSSPATAAKIKWIEIEFQDRAQRDEFLEIWRK